ncbi:Uncharacterised protein [Enterococcus casseliflavus]|uniref:Hachiman antiphage defense system protein HamA n=1 Tax=Enterococcus casseliflavus TaxID=37734 RepID=UPI000E04F424|nr:Hachiman antiphage defense system protein HamA [Enterococcus casseliflavus]GEB27487.1 hypothetical protein ECA02_05820 [Enterococcus casseliflavus]STP32554.1 Uncharacterised protein [Enterococcus casseliflavus]
MTIQDDMIGKHPDDGIFHDWIRHEDTKCSISKRHRALSEINDYREKATIDVAKWLIKYHLSDRSRDSLKRKKEILEKYDFDEYANSLKIFPVADKTKKGNFGEVLLTEYLSKTSGIEVLVFKLRFNPNPDQSMKGDDVLLVDENRVIVGESKFRTIPNGRAVKAACENMDKELMLPISLGFVADRLYEAGETELASKIDDIQFKLSKSTMDIKNVGFLISTQNTKRNVERSLEISNKDFIFVSLGIDNPKEFMEVVFEKAKELVREGEFDEY